MAKKPPYVSALRNRPRTGISPPPIDNPESEECLACNLDPSLGRFAFRPSGPPFIETVEKSSARNRSLVNKSFGTDCQRLHDIIELEYRIYSHYAFIIEGWGDARVNNSTDILAPTFLNNLLSLCTSQQLTEAGHVLNARLIMRHVFEGLMIAKLSSVDHSSEVFDKWLDGVQINFTNEVLKRIRKPGTDGFKQLWRLLSECVHSSRNSIQIDLIIDSETNAEVLNLIWITMLLESNYHLLSSHLITPSMRNYHNTFAPPDDLDENLSSIRQLFKKNREIWLGKGARSFIHLFKATWTLT